MSVFSLCCEISVHLGKSSGAPKKRERPVGARPLGGMGFKEEHVSGNSCDAAIRRWNRRATQEIIQEGQLLEIPATAGTAEHVYILPGPPNRVYGPKDSFWPVPKYLN